MGNACLFLLVLSQTNFYTFDKFFNINFYKCFDAKTNLFTFIACIQHFFMHTEKAASLHAGYT